MIVRTTLYAELGIEYHADFISRNGSFVVARLPFSTFTPHVNGVPVVSLRGELIPELERRLIVGLGLAFFPQRNDPDRCDGSFYLSLSHIKCYRRRIYICTHARGTASGDAARCMCGTYMYVLAWR